MSEEEKTEVNKHKRFLQPTMCHAIVEQAVKIRPDFRVELSLRGDPLLNDRLLELLSIIRQTAPSFQISLFTNGLRLLDGTWKVQSILDSGVNILCLDCYNGTYDRFLRFARATGEKVVDFRSFTAYKRYKNGSKLRLINLVPDIQEGKVDVRQVHNNAGNVDPKYLESLPEYPRIELPRTRRCSRPFRELVVYYDGSIPICCHDWRGELLIGTVRREGLYGAWYGARHLEVLQRLYNADRGMEPCCACDYHGGYRCGLLQDPGA